LASLEIPVERWVGNFTANNKMMQYLQTFANISDHGKFIYHTGKIIGLIFPLCNIKYKLIIVNVILQDLDEMPDKTHMRKALSELASNKCDAIRGIWTERVSREGHLSDINVRSGMSMEEQFPYKCKISDKFVPEWTIGKVVAYRADLRVTKFKLTNLFISE